MSLNTVKYTAVRHRIPEVEYTAVIHTTYVAFIVVHLPFLIKFSVILLQNLYYTCFYKEEESISYKMTNFHFAVGIDTRTMIALMMNHFVQIR